MHIDRFPSILSISECHSVFHNGQQNYITPSCAKHFSIPLSFRPTGYTGSGQCKRYRSVQKKSLNKNLPSTFPASTYSIFPLHSFIFSFSNSPIFTSHYANTTGAVIPYDFPECIIPFFLGDILEQQAKSAKRKKKL